MSTVHSQSFSTTTQLFTFTSTTTVQVVASITATSEWVGGPDVIDGCPWVEIQTSPDQIVKINFTAYEGTTLDFYIVAYADYYPYGTNCRPLGGNPLLAEKTIQSFSQDWTPPRPGKYYLIWSNAGGAQ